MPALGPSWLDPTTLMNNLISSYGSLAFWAAVAIIFAECGLLIGFFLPGDSLLFIVGLFIAGTVNANGEPVKLGINIWAACLILSAAAIIGNLVGYWIGYKSGPALFKRDDSKLFKKKYVERTHVFFEKYGARAIVMARFVPIVRTFITAVAGVGQMSYRRYALYSAIGGVIWASGVTILGYYLGQNAWVKKNIEVVLIGIIVISVIPMVIEYLRHRKEAPRVKGRHAAR